MAIENEQAPAAAPSEAAKRDLLGQVCFWLHIGVVLFVVLGWLIPWVPGLILYLLFLPAMFLQWQFNKSSCVLNNIESFLRTGHWRNPRNREEGAWLKTLLEDVFGWRLTRRQVDAFNYSIILLFWLAGAAHLFFWQGQAQPGS